MEKIKLDLVPSGKMPSLHASQFDDGREHGIDLFENGVVYKLDGTETLTINERKGDNCICSLDIENTFAESNHIVFASTEQMCAVWGNNICELVIKRGSVTLGTLNFILEIEPSPTEGGIESESEISNLERQITEITEQVIGDNYYTKTQTDEAISEAIEGKADTTYVNEELAKKADKTDTYTKTQVDNEISRLDGRIDTKANASDVYTKSQTDNLLNDKADVTDLPDMSQYYDKSEVDDLLDEKADADNTYTKAQVDDIVYGILPDDTASGSVANFTTSLELPIKSLEVDVNAVQEAGTPTPATPLPISGWSEVSLTKCGVNLWDEETENGYLSSSDGSFISHANSICSKNYRLINSSAQVYVATSTDKTLYICWYDEDKTFISRAVCGNTSVTSPLNARYFKLSCYNYGSTYNNDTSVNYPSTDTAYHTYNSTTEVIELGGTYYGGKIDVTTGKFLITHEKANTPSRNATEYGGLSSRGVRFPSALNGSYRFAKAVCNMARVVYSTNYFLGCMAVGIDNAQIYWFGIIDLLGLADLDAFKNWLDNNPLEVYYEITTPIEIQLTPTQIKTLVGTNNIFADTGNTSVVFKCSVNDYVSAHSGGNLLGMGGVYLGGAKSGGSEEEPDEGEDTGKTKEIDEPKEETKKIGDTKKLGGE